MRKIMALVLAAMMLLACCSALAEAPEGYPEVKEGIDFEGKDVYIYDYWSATDWKDNTAEKTEEEQAQYDYRTWLEDTYNVKLHQIQRGDWGTCAEEMTNFNTTPEDDKLAIFIIEPGKVGSLVANGVAHAIDYDLSADKCFHAGHKVFSEMLGLDDRAFHHAKCFNFLPRNIINTEQLHLLLLL